MKNLCVLALASGVLLAAVGCSKGKSETGSAVTSTAASTTAATTAAAAPSAAAPAPSATAAAPAFTQKGIKPGKVVVGYMQDLKDESQCAVVTDAPANQAKFAKDGDKLAAMMKGKIVPSCPTTNVVGTCDAGFGMLANYSGPKWTADTAKKDCLAHHQKWVD